MKLPPMNALKAFEAVSRAAEKKNYPKQGIKKLVNFSL
jgi:hypothetical protein